MTPQEIARSIDHTLLKPEATELDIQNLCQEAMKFQFFAVCVNSRFVSLCRDELRGSDVQIASVVGFPLGAMDTRVKAFETMRAVEMGATEIDMVLPIGLMKQGRKDLVAADIKAIVDAAGTARVKVILETSMLTEPEKVRACEISRDQGAAFVKTSTGFGGGGATLEDIHLMKMAVGGKCEIKASGGIKNLEMATALIKAGATRLGTSSGIAIIQGLAFTGKY